MTTRAPHANFPRMTTTTEGGNTMQRAIHTGREAARTYFTDTVAREQAALADPNAFASFPRADVISHCKWGLRWIDCAPEGANHTLAPLQDKCGVPCGGTYNENVGPGANLRAARVARGRHPISGLAA